MVHRQVGYDAGKPIKGRKRFLALDTCLFGLGCFYHSCSYETAGGKQLLQRVKAVGKQVWRLHPIWVDSGFDGSPFMMWVMDGCG